MLFDRMVVKAFIPILILALLFFVLILELVDLFANLWRYLNHDIPLVQILRVALLYLPKCVSFSIPIALLFSISYTLGNFYANNELISVFGSGVSLYRLIVPFILIGALLSVFWFFFEENVVIDTLKRKNELSASLLNQRTSLSNTNVTVQSGDRSIIYFSEYYNDNSRTLSNLTLVRFEPRTRRFLERFDAETAVWEDGHWILRNVRHFSRTEEGYITEEFHSTFEDDSFDQLPRTFQRTVRDVDELESEEALEWIRSLRAAGLPYRGALTGYYTRYSFALTPLMVAILSSAVGGRFKKNVMLMSLLLSLLLSVVYYVVQMVLVIFAKLGYLPPLAGAWGTFLVFTFPVIWLFNKART
jgi:lipopolysaccharide export system permease protein